MFNAIQERKRCNRLVSNNSVAENHSIPIINWGSFRGRRDEGGRYHIGVELWTIISGLGIISGAVQTP